MSTSDSGRAKSTGDGNEEREAPLAASLLTQIGGVGIGADDEFTFASGLHSPIYCDNRVFLSHPRERTMLVHALVAAIRQFVDTDWDAVAGVASAGIPFAAWVAQEFDKPMVYIRPVEKEHGTKRRVEGGLEPGKRVVLVEDLVTTGGSALSAIAGLREAGLTCNHCLSIVDYGFDAAVEQFDRGDVRHQTLTDTEGLLEALRCSQSYSEADLERVRKWRNQVNATSRRVSA